MPSYDYKCPEGHEYVETRSIHDPQQQTVCPTDNCGLELRRIFNAVPVTYNAKGFYSTDKHDLLKPGQKVDY